MHAIVWAISGLAPGCITGGAMGQRGHRLLGDVALGVLGAVLMGSLFWLLGITAPGTSAAPTESRRSAEAGASSSASSR